MPPSPRRALGASAGRCVAQTIIGPLVKHIGAARRRSSAQNQRPDATPRGPPKAYCGRECRVGQAPSVGRLTCSPEGRSCSGAGWGATDGLLGTAAIVDNCAGSLRSRTATPIHPAARPATRACPTDMTQVSLTPVRTVPGTPGVVTGSTFPLRSSHSGVRSLAPATPGGPAAATCPPGSSARSACST